MIGKIYHIFYSKQLIRRIFIRGEYGWRKWFVFVSFVKCLVELSILCLFVRLQNVPTLQSPEKNMLPCHSFKILLNRFLLNTIDYTFYFLYLKISEEFSRSILFILLSTRLILKVIAMTFSHICIADN